MNGYGSAGDGNRMEITAVNFHLLEQCNMKCEYCFVTDIGPSPMPFKEQTRLVKLLSGRFEKITFAGGEPLLCPQLDGLVREAKELGMTTAIVTNGSMVTDQFLDSVKGHLDWIALSMDSACAETHGSSGRRLDEGPMTRERYMALCRSIKSHGIRLKINTVVHRMNCNEDMTELIRTVMPERWKIMQALPIRGQNDNDNVFISERQFIAYVRRNRVDGVAMVPEDNDLMTGSYVMINPHGRFFDNVDGTYRFSRRITKVGVDRALDDIRLDHGKFAERGGYYDWQR